MPLFNYSPLPWLYKFYYLKYLFIILPGTLAGEWLLQVLNLAVTALLSLITFFVLKRSAAGNSTLQRFFNAGVYLLLLGLFFEACEGGIKKDVSTYSYYFVTSGLAFFMLIGLYSLQYSKAGRVVVHYFGANGRNPMVAYMTGNLLLIPLLHLTGLMTVLNSLNTTAWGGLLRGIIFTGIVSLVTLLFVQRKWYWKT